MLVQSEVYEYKSPISVLSHYLLTFFFLTIFIVPFVDVAKVFTQDEAIDTIAVGDRPFGTRILLHYAILLI